VKYKSVVWDLDGVLTDSAPGIISTTKYVLSKMNKRIPSDTVLRMFLGPPLAVSFRELCGMSEKQAFIASDLYRERYRTDGWHDNAVYPGIRPLLKALRDKGCYLCVATGKSTSAAKRILDAFFLTPYFDRIIGSSENQHNVQKQDVIVDALQGNNAAVMIGDRGSDILAARALGIDSIAVSYGYGSDEELVLSRPTGKADSVDALWELLGVEKISQNGYFISVEGNDGCGKTTQTGLLYEWLRQCGFDAMTTREPGGSPVAEKIRAILLDKENMSMYGITEALLFAASRAQHVKEVIEPALVRGKVVITDRFVDSSIAYQGAGQQLGEDMVAQINAPAVDGHYPDTTVYLDLDYRVALKRRKHASEADRIELNPEDFHQRVQDAFRRLHATNRERYLKIDASGTAEDIARAVYGQVAVRMMLSGVA
jgi:dTMP kinase